MTNITKDVQQFLLIKKIKETQPSKKHCILNSSNKQKVKFLKNSNIYTSQQTLNFEQQLVINQDQYDNDYLQSSQQYEDAQISNPIQTIDKLLSTDPQNLDIIQKKGFNNQNIKQLNWIKLKMHNRSIEILQKSILEKNYNIVRKMIFQSCYFLNYTLRQLKLIKVSLMVLQLMHIYQKKRIQQLFFQQVQMSLVECLRETYKYNEAKEHYVKAVQISQPNSDY